MIAGAMATLAMQPRADASALERTARMDVSRHPLFTTLLADALKKMPTSIGPEQAKGGSYTISAGMMSALATAAVSQTRPDTGEQLSMEVHDARRELGGRGGLVG